MAINEKQTSVCSKWIVERSGLSTHTVLGSYGFLWHGSVVILKNIIYVLEEFKHSHHKERIKVYRHGHDNHHNHHPVSP